MPIQFECPSCGRSLKAPESTAGKTAKCPYCQTHVQVPEAVYDAEEPQAAGEPGYGVQPPLEAPQEEARRPCPMCGEMIKVNAVKCRYCGEIFDETLKGAERRKSKSSDEDRYLQPIDWVLAICCLNIGCIVAIVYMIQGKPKGGKMLLINLGLQVIVGFILGLTGVLGR